MRYAWNTLGWMYGVFCLFLSGVGPTCIGLTAQQQELPGDATAGYHLKVYEDLVQLPTLVLNNRDQSFPALQKQDFRVQLDSGPPFVPLNTRLEGDDPIDMALLFDDAGVETSAMLAASAAALQKQLLPQNFPGRADQVEMYAMDCNLVRAKALAGTSVGAGSLFEQLLQSPTLHADEGSTECAHPVHLWDGISVIGKHLREQAGRRVLVVITDGRDAGSHNSWEAVRQYLGASGITLFAIRPVSPSLGPMDASVGLTLPGTEGREDRLALLAGGTGGLVMTTDNPDLPGLLTRTVALLRKRYILEFHRPRNGTAGIHQIEVQVPGRNARTRVSGVTVPLRELDAGADPARVQRDNSNDPVIGDRKVLTSPQH